VLDLFGGVATPDYGLMRSSKVSLPNFFVKVIFYDTYFSSESRQFLRAIINETLRLFPPVPINLRCKKLSIAGPFLDTYTDRDGHE
jgi:hypothetical protein